MSDYKQIKVRFKSKKESDKFHVLLNEFMGKNNIKKKNDAYNELLFNSLEQKEALSSPSKSNNFSEETIEMTFLHSKLILALLAKISKISYEDLNNFNLSDIPILESILKEITKTKP